MLPPGEAKRRQRERCRKNRKKNANYNEYKRGHRQSLRERVSKIKEDTPCKDCGKRYPAPVMEFDHLPGSKKVDTVSRLIARQVAWEKIEAEMQKCDLVCANCHRIRTHIKRPRDVGPLRYIRAKKNL